MKKIAALMQIRSLFRTVLGKDNLAEAEPALPESQNADQTEAYKIKIQEQALLIQPRKDMKDCEALFGSAS